MDDAALRRELERYLALDPDRLFAALIPEDAATGYSLKGRIVRGRQVFGELSGDIRRRVCQSYAAHAATTDNVLDGAALVAGALLAIPDLMKVPVLPLAAIIAKIGLSQFCGKAVP